MAGLPESVKPGMPETARQRQPRRKTWGCLMILCAGVAIWNGATFYQRVMGTRPWRMAHVIRGFVGYGHHETEYSRDGALIAIAHAGQSKVLDWVHGKEISGLEKYQKRGIADFSSDGRIVSRFSDEELGGCAWLWNASDGRLLGQLNLPGQIDKGNFCYPFFSSDDKRIVAICENEMVVWNSSDRSIVGRIKVTRNTVSWRHTFMSWHPTTHEMTGVDADGKLLRFDLDKKTAMPLLAKQERGVKAAEWSPDGTRLVTIDRDDGVVTVWDASSGTIVATLSEKDAMAARFSPDGGRIVTYTRRSDVVRTRAPRVWDRHTRIWDAASGKLIQELPTIGIVTFSPDWSFWVNTGPEGVRIARFDGSELCEFPERFDGHGSTCVFSQDNQHLAYVNGSGLVVVWRYDPIRSWAKALTAAEFWTTLVAVAGLMWIVRIRKPKGMPQEALPEPGHYEA